MAELITTERLDGDVAFTGLEGMSESELNSMIRFPHGTQSSAVMEWFKARGLSRFDKRTLIRFMEFKTSLIVKKKIQSMSFEKMALHTNSDLTYGSEKIVLESATETVSIVNGPIPVPEVSYERPGLANIVGAICSSMESKGGEVVSNFTEIHNKVYISEECGFRPEGVQMLMPLVHSILPAPSSVITTTDKVPKKQGLPFFDEVITGLNTCKLSTYWAIHNYFINHMLKTVTIKNSKLSIGKVKKIDGTVISLFSSDDFEPVKRTDANKIEYDYFVRLVGKPIIFKGTIPATISWRVKDGQTMDNLPLDVHAFSTAWPQKKGLGLILGWVNFCPRQDSLFLRVNILCHMASMVAKKRGNADQCIDIKCSATEAVCLLPMIHKCICPFDLGVQVRVLIPSDKPLTAPDYSAYISYEAQPSSVVIWIDDAALPALQTNRLTIDERLTLQKTIYSSYKDRRPRGKSICFTNILASELFEEGKVFRLPVSPYGKGIHAVGVQLRGARDPNGEKYRFSESVDEKSWVSHVYLSQRFAHTWFFSPKKIYNSMGTWVNMERQSTYTYDVLSDDIQLPLLKFVSPVGEEVEEEVEGEEEYDDAEELSADEIEFSDDDISDDDNGDVLEKKKKGDPGVMFTTVGPIPGVIPAPVNVVPIAVAAPAKQEVRVPTVPVVVPPSVKERKKRVDKEATKGKIGGEDFGGLFAQ